MSKQSTILLVDDDTSLHDLFNDAFSDYTIISAYSGSEGVERFKQESIDLVLLDVNMHHTDGYSVCQQIRDLETGPPVPVLFLSGQTSLEDILKGYGSGGNDYITKPFKLAELIAKVAVEIETYHQEKALQSNLSDVTEAVLSVQSSNAKIYSICRFLQQAFFCKDTDDLCQLFFTVTQGFGTDAALFIHSPDNRQFMHASGRNHALSNAILEQVNAQGGRIVQFGHDRAVFNWESASLLVNHLQDDVDNLAMLMDGFEMGLKAIEASNQFDHLLSNYRETKYQQSVQVAKAFDDVVYEIQDELGSIGYNALSEEQENALVRIVEAKRDFVDGLFNQGLKLDEELSQVMKNLRQNEQDNAVGTDDDGIEFL